MSSRQIAGTVKVTEWLLMVPSVQECFKSEFEKWYRDVQIVGDCIRREFQTRAAACAKLRCTNAVRGRGIFSRL